MLCRRQCEIVLCASERRDRRAPAAVFAANWRVVGPLRRAVPGSLEHFLVERYCLFALRRGRLVRGDIAHVPWELAQAELMLQTCDMTRLLGFDADGPAVSALAAVPMTVAGWWPVPCDR